MGARTQEFAKDKVADSISSGPQKAANLVPAEARTVAPAAPVIPLYPPSIAKALIAITREIQPVAKRGENTFHKYAYAKWEDILAELSPLIAKHGLIIQQDEISHGSFEGVSIIEMTFAFTIINEDGDFWPDRPRITAICKLTDNKGQKDDKAASKCHTQAQKYMMTSLFKIRTADMAEADHDADTGEVQQPKRRAVPSSDGTVKPHEIPIINKETPDAWVGRFLKMFLASKTIEEADAWDTLNDKIITKVGEHDAAALDRLTKAMQAKIVELKGALPPKDGGADQFDAEQWLKEIDAAFSGCEDLSTLAEEQERLMTPNKDKVSPVIWQQAVSIVEQHVKRINEQG